MASWRVNFIGNVLSTPGIVEAPDEKSAIAEATKLLDTTPTGRGRSWWRGLRKEATW